MTCLTYHLCRNRSIKVGNLNFTVFLIDQKLLLDVLQLQVECKIKYGKNSKTFPHPLPHTGYLAPYL